MTRLHKEEHFVPRDFGDLFLIGVSSNSASSEVPADSIDGLDRPRVGMARLPATLQPILTRLTGCPLPAEAPTSLKPWHFLLTGLASVFTGLVSAWLLWSVGGPVIAGLPVCWIFTVYGARLLRNVVLHMCSHTAFTRNRNLDQLIGRAVAVAFVTEEFDGYKRAHIGHHHSSAHQTNSDPTVVFLLQEIGLRPGMPVPEMWRRLWLVLLSPRYHFRFLAARIASHFTGTSLWYRCVVGAWLIVLVTVTYAVGNVNATVAAVVIPLVPVYQVCSGLRLASKHIFPRRLPSSRSRQTVGMFTLGIFLGERCPDAGLQGMKFVYHWFAWWLRMLFYHLPCRLMVMVGDGPAHDMHHRHPCHRDWPNYIYAREADIANASEADGPYREVWGLHAAIGACLQSLSDAEPSDYPLPTRARFTFLTADD